MQIIDLTLEPPQIRMTVTCKLHLIDPQVLEEMLPGNAPEFGQSMWDNTLLGRPKDTYELGVRIWTFWQVRVAFDTTYA